MHTVCICNLETPPQGCYGGGNICGNYVKVRLVAHGDFATKMTLFPVVKSGDTCDSYNVALNCISSGYWLVMGVMAFPGQAM